MLRCTSKIKIKVRAKVRGMDTVTAKVKIVKVVNKIKVVINLPRLAHCISSGTEGQAPLPRIRSKGQG